MDHARFLWPVLALLIVPGCAGLAGFLPTGERLHIEKLFADNQAEIVRAVSDDTKLIVGQKLTEAGVSKETVEGLLTKSPLEWGETGILALLAAWVGKKEYQDRKARLTG